MTGLHPETIALVAQIRALYEEAERAGKVLTLPQVAQAIGRTASRAGQLWTLAGLPKLKAGRRKGVAGNTGRPSKAEIAAMGVLELDLRAATAKTIRDKVRWIRRKIGRGFTPTVEQREILAIDEQRSAAKESR